MSSIDLARSCFDISRNINKAVRLTGAALAAASLAACVQSPGVTDKSAFHTAGGRSTAVNSERKAPREAVTRTAVPRVATRPNRLFGVASYYTEGQLTASGERFDTREFTAAHPTLPFGTRLRVTNVTTGRSVMVRVNDRGPFIRGRVVDVSLSAAKSLGMVHRGVAKVKLDVVQ